MRVERGGLEHGGVSERPETVCDGWREKAGRICFSLHLRAARVYTAGVFMAKELISRVVVEVSYFANTQLY